MTGTHTHTHTHTHTCIRLHTRTLSLLTHSLSLSLSHTHTHTIHTYINSITLILISADDGSCDSHMTYLLELVFNAMVMVVGLQELDSTSNIERLKQNMKVRSGRPEIIMRLYQDTLLFSVQYNNM